MDYFKFQKFLTTEILTQISFSSDKFRIIFKQKLEEKIDQNVGVVKQQEFDIKNNDKHIREDRKKIEDIR